MSTTARLRATPESDFAHVPATPTRGPSRGRMSTPGGDTRTPVRGGGGADATVIDLRPAPRVRPQRPNATPPMPQRRRFQWAPGSRQVVSVRGRRIVAPKADPVRVRFAIVLVVTLLAGVMLTIYLSGLTTQQTFRLQELSRTDSRLGNQIETLNRDHQSATSAAEIARRAAELGMVIPDQPGVLSVRSDGGVDELRAAEPDAVRPIIDVNGSRVIPGPASSDPVETDAVVDRVQPLPRGGLPGAEQMPVPVPSEPPAPAPIESPAAPPVSGANSLVPAIAPYAPNVRTDRTGGSGQ
ncbi:MULTISPECIES: hypothetical protein [unclassified Corynebacterium]|uniref:hypothetical protein n=1 Tax=unclassified Corynebacterium TaxID=2624378 RepID=UPI0035261725